MLSRPSLVRDCLEMTLLTAAYEKRGRMRERRRGGGGKEEEGVGEEEERGGEEEEGGGEKEEGYFVTQYIHV